MCLNIKKTNNFFYLIIYAIVFTHIQWSFEKSPLEVAKTQFTCPFMKYLNTNTTLELLKDGTF